MPVEILCEEAGGQLCFAGLDLDVGEGSCYRLFFFFQLIWCIDLDHLRASAWGPCHLPDFRGV